MDKSMVTGLIIGAVVATAGGVIGGLSMFGDKEPTYAEVINVVEATETVQTPREVCEDVPVTRQAPVKDENKLLGTVTGAVIGGSNLLVGSVEVDQPISDNWAIAAFIDSGNAYDDFDSFDTATGVGAGIRWFSPLGPIRVDVAVPLENDAPDSWRLHITLGPDL